MKASTKNNPCFVKNEFEKYFGFRLEKHKDQYNDYKLKDDELEVIKLLYNTNPDVGYDLIYNILHKLILNSAYIWNGEEFRLIDDGAFYNFTGKLEDSYDDQDYLFITAKNHILKYFSEQQLIALVRILYKEKYTTLISLGLDIAFEHPNILHEPFFELLISDDFLDSYEHTHSRYFQFALKRNLTYLYSFFNPEQKQIVIDAILNLKCRIWRENEQSGKLRLTYGYSQYVLINALPDSALSDNHQLKKKYQEYLRRYGELKYSRPEEPKVYWGKSVLNTHSYEKMSLDDWEKSFQKYTGRGSRITGEISVDGHSEAFSNYVAKSPDLYYPLIRKITLEETIPFQYSLKGLTGLIQGSFNVEKCEDVFVNCTLRKDVADHQVTELVRLSGYFIKEEHYSESVFDYLKTIAFQSNSTYQLSDNHLFDGINSSAGAAVEKLMDFYKGPGYGEKIFELIEKIAASKDIAIKAVVVWKIAYMNNIDKEKSLNLFLKLVSETPKQLFYPSLQSLQYLIHIDFRRLLPFFKVVIEQLDKFESQRDCAQILMVAWYHNYEGSWNLLEHAFEQSQNYKIGALIFATDYHEDFRFSEKAWKVLWMFLDEPTKEIAFRYQYLFRKLEPKEFSKHYPFIKKYTSSITGKYREDEYYNYLLQCVEEDPERCIELTVGFSDHTRPDISQTALEDEPLKVVVQAYNAIRKYDEENEYLEQAMDLIDDFFRIKEYRSFIHKLGIDT